MLLQNGLVVDENGGTSRRDLLVREGLLADPEEAASGEEIFDASAYLVAPGLVNSHTHSNENFFRGRFENLPLELWMLFSYPVLSAPAQTPDEVYARTLLGAVEMLRTGTTTTVDFLYELPAVTEESVGAVVRAYRDAGLRAVVAIAMSDRGYAETVPLPLHALAPTLASRLDEECPPRADEWLDLGRRLIERYHSPEDGITIGLAPSGPQRCSDELLLGARRLSDERGVPVHLHVLETKPQAVTGHELYDEPIVAHLAELGFLSPRVSCAHTIWLTAPEVDLLAESGASAVHNPVSNLKLGSGLAPLPALLSSGVNVALGTDGPASNDSQNLFEVVKLTALLHKLHASDFESWIGARDAWRMATVNGAACAGDPELGRIAPGARADLALFELRTMPFTPLHEPLLHLAYCSPASSVAHVLVGGRWVVRAGRTTGVDEAALLEEAGARGRDVVRRCDDAFRLADELVPAVTAGYREALAANVGVDRYASVSV